MYSIILSDKGRPLASAAAPQLVSKYVIFLRNFYARCSPQIKDMFFLLTKIEKINLKPLKRKNPFCFLVLQEYYAQYMTAQLIIKQSDNKENTKTNSVF